MDLALGVAVAGPVARVALLESSTGGHGVLDESVVDLADDPIARLTETVVETNRSLTDQFHRLVATGLCWSDQRLADQLRHALADRGVGNVEVLSESQAATALVRNLSGGGSQRGSAVLLVNDDTAQLSIVNGGPVGEEPLDGSNAVSAASVLLDRLSRESVAAENVYLIASSSDVEAIARELEATSSLPIAVPDALDFAIARGAAMGATVGLVYPAGDATAMAPAATTERATAVGDATAMAPAAMTERATAVGDATAMAPAAMTERATAVGDATAEQGAATGSGQQLAYSMENDDPEFLPMEYGDDEDEVDAAPPPVGRALLIGSTVGGILVAGLAALAVAVTIGVRPTAASHPQPPAPAQQKSVPGNFVPALPVPASEVQAPPVPVPDAGVRQGGPAPDVGGGAPGLAPPASPAPPPDVGPNIAPPPPPAIIPVPIPIPFPIPQPSTTGGTTTGTTTGGTTTGTTTGGTTDTTTGTTTASTTGTATGSSTTGGGTTSAGTTSASTTGTTTASTTGTATGSSTTGGGTTSAGTTTASTTGTTTGSSTTGPSTGASTTGGGTTSAGTTTSSTTGPSTGASTTAGGTTSAGTTGASTGG